MKLAGYTVTRNIAKVGRWQWVELENEGSNYFGRLSDPLGLAKPGQGQESFNDLFKLDYPAGKLRELEPTSGIYEPIEQRILLVYLTELSPLYDDPDDSELIFLLRSLLVHDQLDEGCTSVADIWVDEEGKAWVEPFQPSRYLAEKLDDSSWLDTSNFERLDRALEAIWHLVSQSQDEGLDFCASALKELYGHGLAGGTDDLDSSDQKEPDYSFLKLNRLQLCTSDITPISCTMPPDSGRLMSYDSDESTPSESDCDHEWYNGNFWEPCRIYRGIKHGPQPRKYAIIETNFGLQFSLNFINQNHLRSRTAESRPAWIEAVSSRGYRLREGLEFEIEAIPCVTAKVISTSSEGTVTLEFKRPQLTRKDALKI